MNTDKDLQRLLKMHSMAKRADKALFAEQRNNILIKSGKHHKRSSVKSFSDTTRGFVESFNNQQIRITKNHIPRIVNIYTNGILDGNPSVTTRPYNKDEMSDNKASSLANSVLLWIKRTNKWRKKQRQLVNEYITIGEAFAKISFDPNEGPLVETINEFGEPEKIPTGEIVIDKAFGFDIKIDPSARDFDDARWLIHESIVDLDDFKALLKDIKPEMIPNIKEGIGAGHHAFDAQNGVIAEVKDKVVIMELYKRPNSKSQKGEYVMFTKDFIVAKSSLPFGIWNWAYVGFDEMITSSRSTSIIKTCRPYQIEINRSASKMAEHQITLGDDKVFIQKGTKLANAGNMSGIRAYSYAGEMPVIQAGRSGAQYLEYQVIQIKEMYEACNLEMVSQDKAPQGDPYQMLYTSMKDKKRFSIYATKYEDFEVDIFSIALQLAKKHLSTNTSIKVVGSSERVNISEFKKIGDDSFDFYVEPISGDIETKFGEVLRSTSILQYAGSSLGQEQLGRLIKDMPFGKNETLSSTLTAKQDHVDNTLLALDRGEVVELNEFDDHDTMISALISRITKSDFKFLSDSIQKAYREKLQLHTDVKSIQLENIKKAEQGLVPSGGFLTTINASWLNPATGRIERIKAPSESIQWLMEKLQNQGALLKEFQGQSGAVEASVGKELNSNQGDPKDPVVSNVPQAQG